MKFTRIASAIVLAYGLSSAAMAQVASTQNTDGGSTSSKKDGAELLLQRLEIERLVKVGGGEGLMTLGGPPAGA